MMLLALYVLVAEESGVASEQLGGTVQNDILKGIYCFEAPTFTHRSLRCGSLRTCSHTAQLTFPNGTPCPSAAITSAKPVRLRPQEIAFTLSNARAYVRAALSTGLDVDDFAPRLSFFFACHNNILEEVAKFRAARRMWAHIMRDEFEAKEKKSLMLRFHTQTGGSTLTAQQPENNIVRTAYQALAAVLGGTQSLHTNAMDEALGLPTESSARVALRTQQLLAHESGVNEAIDPLAGSYYVEHLTDELESQASTPH